MLEKELIVLREQHLLYDAKTFDDLEKINDIEVSLQLLNSLVQVEVF